MKKTDLLEKYPNLLDKCKEWDCSFTEAIEKIEDLKRKGSLKRFI